MTFLKGVCIWIRNGVLFALFVIAVLLMVSAFHVPGNIRSLVVLSGSMEPSIQTGSLIFIRPSSEYFVGDIVTRKAGGEEALVTHRIVSVAEVDGRIAYATKGDANKTNDEALVRREDILGKSFFVIPFLGYPVNYVKTSEGFIFFIIIPAVIIIYEQFQTLKREIAKRWLKRKNNSAPKEATLPDVSTVENATGRETLGKSFEGEENESPKRKIV